MAGYADEKRRKSKRADGVAGTMKATRAGRSVGADGRPAGSAIGDACDRQGSVTKLASVWSVAISRKMAVIDRGTAQDYAERSSGPTSARKAGEVSTPIHPKPPPHNNSDIHSSYWRS